MFYTIKENASAQIVEKKSKFIANIFYIETDEEAENIIKQTKKKYYDARHNCYAFITFDNKSGEIIEKCSDDGEPSGTAGAPILAILKGHKLCNTLVIVTRYFGGILLGTGGLVRAYSDATNLVVKNASFVEIQRGRLVKLTMSYADVENLKYYARKNNITIIKEEYLENVEILIEISNEMLEKLTEDIDKLSIKMTKIDILEEKYIKSNITA